MSSHILSAQTQSIHSHPTLWVYCFTILCLILRSFLQVITSPRFCFSSHSLTHPVWPASEVPSFAVHQNPVDQGLPSVLQIRKLSRKAKLVTDLGSDRQSGSRVWPWIHILKIRDEPLPSPNSPRLPSGRMTPCYTVRIYIVLYWSYTKLYWYVLVFYMWPIWL